MKISDLAGKVAPKSILIDVSKLVAAYFNDKPDPRIQAECVSFGTSGHRGCAFNRSFNEDHILAITQAICNYRRQAGITGPLFIGFDTHALSKPAMETALEVLAANGVEVMMAEGNEFTPTPVISHAIIGFNRLRPAGLSDGIVITPSHNPPGDGGFKYNPTTGGPASIEVTSWIETRANEFLRDSNRNVRRISISNALRASSTHRYDFLNSYVNHLSGVIDLASLQNAGLKLAVDPLGGAGVNYWPRISERYNLNIAVVNKLVDPTFSFMTVDWDGQIRMDPSSEYAMRPLLAMREKYDLSFACDTDHDRHGIVSKKSGLIPPNHFLAAAISQIFLNRPKWSKTARIGKTIVSSSMIDRVAKLIARDVFEVPVGFKWFVDGLLSGSLGFCGEESAGATFLRIDGGVWTTDKDGFIPCLYACEMMAKTGQDPGDLYAGITRELGNSFYERRDAAASTTQRAALGRIAANQIKVDALAGEPVEAVLTTAPGNETPFGGVKVIAENGWFAARPSGTEDIYKIYAESFRNEGILKTIIQEAEAAVTDALSGIV